jgi:hypothetical protein
MRKPVHDQRPLFHPYLAWEQLPDPVRQQALDLLAALCLEVTDLARLGEQDIHRSLGNDNNGPDPRDRPRDGVPIP